MNANWAKILLFSILFLVLGFILGRMCGSCHQGSCGPEGGGMRGDAECHGAAGKGACCKDDHHEGMGAAHMDTVKVVGTHSGDTLHVVTAPAH